MTKEETINLNIENKSNNWLLLIPKQKKYSQYESINMDNSQLKDKIFIVESFEEFEVLAIKNNFVIFLANNKIILYYKSIYYLNYEELIEISFDIEYNLSGKRVNVFKFENKYGFKKEIIICPVENIRTNSVNSEYYCSELLIDCKKINNLIDNKRKEYIKNSMLYNI